MLKVAPTGWRGPVPPGTSQNDLDLKTITSSMSP